MFTEGSPRGCTPRMVVQNPELPITVLTVDDVLPILGDGVGEGDLPHRGHRPLSIVPNDFFEHEKKEEPGDLMKRLVEAFRRGSTGVEPDDLYSKLELDKTEKVRPSLLSHVLTVDRSYVEHVKRQVQGSPVSGERIGTTWTPQGTNVIRPRADDDVWVSREDLRPLDDVCTKFCTFKYFPDAFSRVTMVINVLRLFSHVSQPGVDTKVVFKGGVMQRILLLELLHDLPPEAKEIMLRHLGKHKALSISDMDFEIVAGEVSDEKLHRITLVSFLVMTWLQHQLNLELHGQVRPRLLNREWDAVRGQEELKEMLQRQIQDLPETHPLHGSTVDGVTVFPNAPPNNWPHRTKSGKVQPKPRTNLFIFKCSDGEHCVADAKTVLRRMGVHIPLMETSLTAPLYTNMNLYIGEGTVRSRKDHLLSMFHLVRIKHSFTMYYTTKYGEKRVDRLAGEMIDMSQGTPYDENKIRMMTVLKNPYQQYPVLGGKGTKIHSYSMTGFFLDILHTLHHSDTEPWNANKLQKRQSRYVSFYVGVVLQSLTVSEGIEELSRLEHALVSGKPRGLRLDVTKYVFRYESSVSGQPTFRRGFLTTLRHWIKALEAKSNTLSISDIHLYQLQKFIV
jgi:hypothetical protein